MEELKFKQGEAKTVRFTVTENSVAVDLGSTTIQFYVENEDASGYLIQKEDGDFDKAQAALGIVTVPLSATETNQTPGEYLGELKIQFTASNIDKSANVSVHVERAIIS